MRNRRQPVVPPELVQQVDDALAAVDRAQEEVDRAYAARAPLTERRLVHADLTRAFDRADAVLREATTLAKERSKLRSFQEWTHWRRRLSALDTARQIHLFAQQDDCGVLGVGSVQAIDTGMSGPAIGDLLHGETQPEGAPATYGLDLEAVLAQTALLELPAAPIDEQAAAV